MGKGTFPAAPKTGALPCLLTFTEDYAAVSILNLQCTLGFTIKQSGEVSTCQNKIQKYPITFKSTTAPLWQSTCNQPNLPPFWAMIIPTV